ncbi:MAG TPA: adenylate/guanylate cyclase domain-containing protein [Bryobacteraceae bacterium]|nr:adenylate/guanylate cyclase domain-containing protein [Bryobacteraceae bacterium]
MYSPKIRRKLRRGVAVVSGLIAFGLWFLGHRGSLDWLENRTSDRRAVATADPSRANRDIVIIDIDNTSYTTLGEKLGRWPWTRRVWTELVRYLTPGKPRLILFDILFSGSEDAADPEFAAVMRSARNVVLPFAFASSHIETSSDIFTPPVIAQLRVEGDIPGEPLDRQNWSLNQPAAELAAAMAASGATQWMPDPDGMTRRLPLAIRYDGKPWATVWLAAAQHLRKAEVARFSNGEFAAGSLRLPVDPQGRFVPRWHGDTLNSYRLVPLWEMICSIYPKQCDPSVKRHPADEFAGKIVFVGASALGSYEVRPTPVSETAPGVFVLATALDNLLAGEAVRQAPAWLGILMLLLMTAVPAASVLIWRSITAPLGVTLALLAAYGGACFLLYGHNYWLPMAAPMLAAALSFTGNTGYRYLTVDRELARTRGTLERYVSPQLVRQVMDNLDNIRFDGEKRRLTVLFSDVRSFTTLTEKSDPVELLKQLNEYLEAMTEIIFRYDGIVDKFIGDGIMAHWGAFTPNRPNAELAARAALDMIATLAVLNQKWVAGGRPPLDIGVGLNTDEVIFGNVGTGKKMDFTAIGDGVNLASRLESANKEFHTHIIVSASTLAELGPAAEVRSLGSIVVKGKTVGVDVFELLNLKQTAAKTTSASGPGPSA